MPRYKQEGTKASAWKSSSTGNAHFYMYTRPYNVCIFNSNNV